MDEFAQFARLRGPRLVPADLNRLVDETLNLYAGVLQAGSLRIERRFAPGLPLVRLDVEQIRQVIINLVDNAMEALGGMSAPARPTGEPPTIVVETRVDERNGIVRLLVTDNGPGVPAADRDKLFMPYYSTKGAAAAWAWPSCGASWWSTAAGSRPVTPRRTAPPSPSNCRRPDEYVHDPDR